MEIETEKKKALVLPMDALVEDGDEALRLCSRK